MPLESTISSTADGLYQLKLYGRLHRPHWVAQLFSALARLQISVISGEATQEKGGEWKSSFFLDFSGSSADPHQLNYSAFAEQSPSDERHLTPKLNSFELSRRPDQLLEVRLEGPDQIGFLASFLARVSGLALFPSKLEIDTMAGQIKDCIVLRGVGDRGPSEAAYQSLNRMLKSFLPATST
ncbi:MAG TPA: hypothetical protein VL981_11795 [Candidatus Methylacidiphilales bacterium]|nr:hypothetical protein [Candidatus Methylacidiphilales bacterium]